MEAKFFKRLTFVALSIIVWLLLLQFVAAPWLRNTDEFLAATLDKQRLLQTVPSPRIIFAGGSNLAFGIDSKRISDSIGVPVVNMGLHGGLGLNYILREAKEGIRSNDVIILSTEYYLGGEGSPKLLSQLVDLNPGAFKYAATGLFPTIRLYSQNLQRCISTAFYKLLKFLKNSKGDKKDPYHRHAFNNEGDDIGHLDDTNAYPIELASNFPDEYSDGIKAMNDFIAYAKTKNSHVYYIFPNFPASFYTRDIKFIKRFEKEILESLDCEVLNTSETFVLPDNRCYDSVYHLNKLGRKERTNILITILKAKKLTEPAIFGLSSAK